MFKQRTAQTRLEDHDLRHLLGLLYLPDLAFLSDQNQQMFPRQLDMHHSQMEESVICLRAVQYLQMPMEWMGFHDLLYRRGRRHNHCRVQHYQQEDLQTRRLCQQDDRLKRHRLEADERLSSR